VAVVSDTGAILRRGGNVPVTAL